MGSARPRFALLVLLLWAAAIGLIALAGAYPVRWDVSLNARQTLSDASERVLRQMPGELRITVYATGQDPKLGDIRQIVAGFVALYQRVKPDIELRFVDPRQDPKAAADMRANGELMLSYQGRRERLTTLNEQAMTNALVRLSRASDKLVLGLEGHGERSLTGVANHDLGEFGKHLAARGLKLGGFNLGLAQQVPANAALLVLTHPRVELFPGEVEKLKGHLERGGNLLWLIDPEPLRGLEPLAEYLGLVLPPGTVVDPAAQELHGRPTWALASTYGPHPVTERFNLLTLFPDARPVAVAEATSWRATPLIEVAPQGWVRDGPVTGEFDAGRDTRGPVTIGIALTRSVHERPQRVVVIGNGAFLSNTFVGNGGNLDLGLNLVNWLVGDERLITIQPRPTVDAGLQLGRTTLLAIALAFLVVFPLALLAAGALTWWRRR